MIQALYKTPKYLGLIALMIEKCQLEDDNVVLSLKRGGVKNKKVPLNKTSYIKILVGKAYKHSNEHFHVRNKNFDYKNKYFLVFATIDTLFWVSIWCKNIHYRSSLKFKSYTCKFGIYSPIFTLNVP